jgi:hypothetical protein
MGKNWKVKRKTDRGGGGGLDLTGCRGLPIVIATCDPGSGREASKELVTLLQQAIEEVYPELLSSNNNNSGACDGNESDDDTAQVPKKRALTIQEMLEEELASVRKTNSKSQQNSAQPCVSINTDVRGVVLVKINIAACCPVVLVKSLFDKVKREKNRISRYVVRLSPLQHTFYPSYEEYFENIYKMLQVEFEGFSSASYQNMIDEMHNLKRKRQELELIDSIKKSKSSSSGGDEAACGAGAAADAGDEVVGDSGNSKATNSMIGKEEGLDEKEILRREMIRKERQERKNAMSSLKTNSKSTVPDAELARVGTDSGLSVTPFKYAFHFKSRNHNTLERPVLANRLKMSMPEFAIFSKDAEDYDVSSIQRTLFIHTYIL